MRICIICNRFYPQRYEHTLRIPPLHCKSALKRSSTSSSTWKQRIYYFTFPADTLNETPGGSRGKKGEKNPVVLHLPRAISSHLYVYLGLVSVRGLTMIFLNVQVYNGYYHIARRCTER